MINFLSFLKEKEDPMYEEFSNKSFPEIRYSENDNVFIEDETGKIELNKHSIIKGFSQQDLTVHSFVTGSICIFRGKVD